MVLLFSNSLKEHQGSPCIIKRLSLFPRQAGTSVFPGCVLAHTSAQSTENQDPHTPRKPVVGSKACMHASAASFFPPACAVILSPTEAMLNSAAAIPLAGALWRGGGLAEVWAAAAHGYLHKKGFCMTPGGSPVCAGLRNHGIIESLDPWLEGMSRMSSGPAFLAKHDLE